MNEQADAADLRWTDLDTADLEAMLASTLRYADMRDRQFIKDLINEIARRKKEQAI